MVPSHDVNILDFGSVCQPQPFWFKNYCYGLCERELKKEMLHILCGSSHSLGLNWHDRSARRTDQWNWNKNYCTDSPSLQYYSQKYHTVFQVWSHWNSQFYFHCCSITGSTLSWSCFKKLKDELRQITDMLNRWQHPYYPFFSICLQR